MRKPDSLRQLLLATVDGTTRNPESLQLFVEQGRIAGGGGRSLSFQYHYTLRVLFQAYAGDVDVIVVSVLAWLGEHQPELLDKPDAQPFGFQVDIIDQDTSDVEVAIELTEAVIVTPLEGGGYGVESVGAPARHDIDRFAGVPCGARLWRLFLAEELIARTANPAAGPSPA